MLSTMEKLQASVIRTAHDLWLKGWAERNAGNLSVRLVPAELAEGSRREGSWRPLETALPELGGEHFLFTDTGRYAGYYQGGITPTALPASSCSTA